VSARPSRPPQVDVAPDSHPIALVLERYAVETAIEPNADLVRRILVGLEVAPSPVRPWSFLGALVRLDAGAALRDARDVSRAIFDRGVPVLFKAQFLAILLLVVLAVGALGAAGAVTLGPIVEQIVRPARSSDDAARRAPPDDRRPSSEDQRAASEEDPRSPQRLDAPDRRPADTDVKALPGKRRALGHTDRVPASERARGGPKDENPGVRSGGPGHGRGPAKTPGASRGKGDAAGQADPRGRSVAAQAHAERDSGKGDGEGTSPR
jgi:hypothetical protein